jgi:SAM-dependent methyltransferase
LAPSPWIVRHAHLVPAGARVLDLACGFGRHARFFAQRGASVLAVDRDAEALATMEDVAGIETRQIDLEGSVWPFADERFDAIVVTNYLHRPALPQIVGCVADDGTLLYETFGRGNEAYGRPSNPDFLLEPGELLAVAYERLIVVAFAQGFVDTGQRGAVVQQLAAVGRKRRWPPAIAPDGRAAGG